MAIQGYSKLKDDHISNIVIKNSDNYFENNNSTVQIYSEHAKPFGYTYNEWSKRWWIWLLSIPKSQNPSYDNTGANSKEGQTEDKVFFLCQTIEGVYSIPHRHISLKSGMCIFMPVLNWISVLHQDGETDEELLISAKKRMDLIGDLDLIINEKKIADLKKYRFQSSFFNVLLPENNILDFPSGETRVISDGYWIFTEPLYTDIEISSFGSCSAGITKIGVNYSIKIS